MSEDNQRAQREFVSRVGTFFVVIGLFSVMIFVASDMARSEPEYKAAVTQTYIVEAIQALQTRDAGAAKAMQDNRPTPRLIPAPDHQAESMLTFIPLFCFGSLGLLFGGFLIYRSAEPAKPGGRFQGIRKFLQKQREAKAKREKEKKEKAEKAKAKKK